MISGTEITVGFGNIPGPRLKGQSWFLWVVLVLLALPILIIIAGIGGAIGGVLTIVAPGLGATAWGTIGMLTIVPLLLVGTFFGGRIRVYQYFEIIMLVLVVVMTVVMVYLAFVGIPFGAEEFRYSFGDLVAGMAFQLPEGTLLSALAVLGGVGAGIELLFYSPWLAAKGYARQAHGTSSVHDRDERLATWLSVTKIDTWLGVVATLLISVAYFITGGSILAALGVVPDGVNVVETVSNVVTETLGQPFFYGFLVAALAGLYSTALGIADGTARLLNSVSDQMSSAPRSTADRRVLYRWPCASSSSAGSSSTPSSRHPPSSSRWGRRF